MILQTLTKIRVHFCVAYKIRLESPAIPKCMSVRVSYFTNILWSVYYKSVNTNRKNLFIYEPYKNILKKCFFFFFLNFRSIICIYYIIRFVINNKIFSGKITISIFVQTLVRFSIDPSYMCVRYKLQVPTPVKICSAFTLIYCVSRYKAIDFYIKHFKIFRFRQRAFRIKCIAWSTISFKMFV